jgi:hypothetical protein
MNGDKPDFMNFLLSVPAVIQPAQRFSITFASERFSDSKAGVPLAAFLESPSPPPKS